MKIAQIGAIGLLTALAGCNQESALQELRDQSVTEAVTAVRSRFHERHADLVVEAPTAGWVAASEAAAGSTIDWFDCRIHLEQLMERQLASDRPASEYFTSDQWQQGVTGTTFNGLPAADIAKAAAIWAGAEVSRRVDALRSRDAIATATRSAISEQASWPETQYNASDPAIEETAPPGTGNAVEELAQQAARQSELRSLERLGGSYQITANDIQCMRAAGLNVTEKTS